MRYSLAIAIVLVFFLSACSSDSKVTPSLTNIPPAPTLAASSTAIPQASATAAPVDDCLDWSQVSAKDAGRQLCVRGKALYSGKDQVAYYLKFDANPQSFYMVSYNSDYPELAGSACVQVTGTVQKIGSAPVIVLDHTTQPAACGAAPVVSSKSNTLLPTVAIPATLPPTAKPAPTNPPAPTSKPAPTNPPVASGCPSGCTSHLSGCDIKGNVTISTGEKIYHVPGGAYYSATKIDPQYGERWFCTEAEAQANGWRRSAK